MLKGQSFAEIAMCAYVKAAAPRNSRPRRLRADNCRQAWPARKPVNGSRPPSTTWTCAPQAPTQYAVPFTESSLDRAPHRCTPGWRPMPCHGSPCPFFKEPRQTCVVPRAASSDTPSSARGSGFRNHPIKTGNRRHVTNPAGGSTGSRRQSSQLLSRVRGPTGTHRVAGPHRRRRASAPHAWRCTSLAAPQPIPREREGQARSRQSPQKRVQGNFSAQEIRALAPAPGYWARSMDKVGLAPTGAELPSVNSSNRIACRTIGVSELPLSPKMMRHNQRPDPGSRRGLELHTRATRGRPGHLRAVRNPARTPPPQALCLSRSRRIFSGKCVCSNFRRVRTTVGDSHSHGVPGGCAQGTASEVLKQTSG